ncbi:MAG: excinuclease ABC subunit UvrA [Oligoflexia bacterium]|nr:excinuclease ABC subunit UvrA [Oligoflexia bacterium]
MNDSIEDSIIIKGAREHNLKNISLSLPRNQITVFTGLSGSGKSSLAFDTIYAEGQRRYVESLSSYARQFLEQLKKPDVDAIYGLSPSISIEQKTTSRNPRSTVGTVTEIFDYLRLLFARVGKPYCYNCGKPISGQSIDQMTQSLLDWPTGAKIHILAPVVQGKKGEYLAEFKKWAKQGFVRAKIDGQVVELAGAKKLEKNKVHDIDLFVDRLVIKSDIKSRLSEALEKAISFGEGFAKVENLDNDSQQLLSIHNACVKCGISYPEVEPRLFSFNNPRGACPSCNGIGLNEPQYDWEWEDEMIHLPCKTCNGLRLRPEALSIRLNEKNIMELSDLTSLELKEFLKALAFSKREILIAEKIRKEILERLQFLQEVGVDYLSLSRPSRTLSGGEAQRIRLATQIGSSLVGVLYVLDEPSIGLHPRDHGRLLTTLRRLRNLGNTILLVEHDDETIRSADHVVDIGPGAGKNGGALIAEGTPAQVIKNPNSLTGAYLSGKQSIPIPSQRRVGNGNFLSIRGARGNNLKNVSCSIPLGTLTTVTGVSGSGKSTLVVDTLYAHLSQKLYNSSVSPSPFDSIEGSEHLDKVIDIDQSPIGRTPRSNPATYTGLFTLIRDLFSQLPEAKMRGFKPGRFSFNVKGGRCEACEGDGMIRVEMHFLPDVFVQCDTCQGRRYNRETLEVKYKGKNIADVLEMDVQEAAKFLENIPAIKQKLETLNRVGLGYIGLGQSSTTLSGGEAQRIKLAKELSKRSTGKTLYILDEPTTGLHFDDVRRLLEILQELVEQGNTVLVIEHNLDVIKVSDFVIDIGPEGGTGGGEIVAAGTPETISKARQSHTGKYLKDILYKN